MICYFGIIILERKIDTGFQGKLAFTFSMKSLIKTCIYSTCIKSFNSHVFAPLVHAGHDISVLPSLTDSAVRKNNPELLDISHLISRNRLSKNGVLWYNSAKIFNGRLHEN
jgi:hypothetical protein